jgi:hypothetical protein
MSRALPEAGFCQRLFPTSLIDSDCSGVILREAVVIKCQADVHLKPSPLFTVGDASQPGAMAIGEATLDVSVNGITAYDHVVVVVSDRTIPVDVVVGRTWLVLPHVNFYKENSELIIESRNDIPDYVLVEHTDSQVKNAYVTDESPVKVRESKDDYQSREPIVDVHESQPMSSSRKYRDTLQGTWGNYSDDEGGKGYSNSRKMMRMSKTDSSLDEFHTFSDYVAERMRNLKADKALQLMARRDIEQVLFKYEMKLLEQIRDPQANGQVERVNRTIVPLLGMSVVDQRRWDTKVHEVERQLNSTENKTTSKTPYETLHGINHVFTLVF